MLTLILLVSHTLEIQVVNGNVVIAVGLGNGETMNNINPVLQEAIANMTLLCMKFSTEKFEINMSLYPTKNELNVYVFKGGYLHAWRNPEQRIQKHRIDLTVQNSAIQQIHKVFCAIEKEAKGAAHA